MSALPRPAITIAALDLEESTRVEGAAGNYAARLYEDWEIWGPNGGYLAAVALRAASMISEIRRPASLYCHFLSTPKFDEVQLRVEFIKKGRRSESLSVHMEQHGKPVLYAMVRTAEEAPGYEHQQVRAPEVPPPDGLKTRAELSTRPTPMKFWKSVEARPIDQRVTQEPRPAATLDWARFQPRACFDDPFVDAARLLILLDTFGWPAASRTYPQGVFVAPNLDTSVWFHHASPQSPWLLVDHMCPVAAGGLMGVHGRVWDMAGKLLATGGAQLCCLPVGER